MELEVEVDATIDADAERLFTLLAQLRRYGEWLAPEGVHRGIEVHGDVPIGLGTRYVDRQAGGPDMEGEVVRFEPCQCIGFRQAGRLPFGAEIVVCCEFRITSEAEGTRVVRHQDMTLPWLLRPLGFVIKSKGTSEGRRVLASLATAAKVSAES